MTRRNRWIIAGLVTLAVIALSFLVPDHLVYLRNATPIERFLVSRTPLGSTQSEVLAWLKSEGVTASIHHTMVEPGSYYPEARIGGQSYLHAPLDRYALPLHTSVVAFYFFDANNTLAEINVVKTTDAL